MEKELLLRYADIATDQLVIELRKVREAIKAIELRMLEGRNQSNVDQNELIRLEKKVEELNEKKNALAKLERDLSNDNSIELN